MLDDKNLRKIILMKIEEEDFIISDSKEILKYIIKNEDLDKIDIDKLKTLNLSSEYLEDLQKIKIDDKNLYNNKSVDEMIINVRKNTLNERIKILLEEQKILEKNISSNDTKEVETKIMNIALKIVDIRRQLQRL